jgi:hypothetical protein
MCLAEGHGVWPESSNPFGLVLASRWPRRRHRVTFLPRREGFPAATTFFIGTIAGVHTGLSNNSGGIYYTYGNNRFEGNIQDVNGSPMVPISTQE